MNENDHDLLIRLETKVEQILIDVKDLKDGVAVRVENLEMRVNDLEAQNDRFNPSLTREIALRNRDWIAEFKVQWRTVIAIASLFGSIAGFIISLLVKFIPA